MFGEDVEWFSKGGIVTEHHSGPAEDNEDHRQGATGIGTNARAEVFSSYDAHQLPSNVFFTLIRDDSDFI